jgi:AraC family transcriptional regulator of adaptative response/methylated-DNA-[protein]-cysteine methyltransferase
MSSSKIRVDWPLPRCYPLGMQDQARTDFDRIARAIGYIERNFKAQPNLEQIAASVNLSPFHFQRLFTEWAGTSPKKFLQYISVEHAKQLLTEDRASMLQTSVRTGLSGPSRLHDLFVTIEGMTPGEYKNGGESLSINYSFAESPFGDLIIASTPKGIAHLAFVTESETAAFEDLRRRFPNATFRKKLDLLQQNALFIFTHDWSKLHEIKLHLKGTDFQLKVWEALLKIPMGRLSTYGGVAGRIGRPKAGRAVGTAVGDNPIAFLIPCHRVIRSTGAFGGYRWGSERKTAMIGWEAARTVPA